MPSLIKLLFLSWYYIKHVINFIYTLINSHMSKQHAQITKHIPLIK